MKLSTALVSAIGLASSTLASSGLIITEAPNSPKPYIIRHLSGSASTALGFTFRVLVSKGSSDGAFSFLTVTAPSTQPILPHYHPGLFETIKGSGINYANEKARVLFPNDFHMLPPSQNHTFRLYDLDSEISLTCLPAGIEKFYQALGDPYKSPQNSPFDPQQPIVAHPSAIALAAKYSTVFNPSYQTPTNIVNGTTPDGLTTWRKPGQTLPGNTIDPYFISSNDGPKYLNTPRNTIVSTLATGAETARKLTIGTLAFTKLDPATYNSPVAQSFQVLEGQLTVQVGKETEDLIQGDLFFAPPTTAFTISSKVAYTKVYAYAAGNDSLVSKLGAGGKRYDAAVPPK